MIHFAQPCTKSFGPIQIPGTHAHVKYVVYMYVGLKFHSSTGIKRRLQLHDFKEWLFDSNPEANIQVQLLTKGQLAMRVNDDGGMLLHQHSHTRMHTCTHTQTHTYINT